MTVQTAAVRAETKTEAAVPAPELGELLDRQKRAFAADMNPDRKTRDERLARLDRLIQRDGDRLAEMINRDFGTRSPTMTAVVETVMLRAAIRHTRRNLKSWMKPRRVHTAMMFMPGRCRLLRQPLGVVGIIGAWNYPLQLTLSPLVDAIAAGNRAMVKPSELAPIFAAGLKESFDEFFAPDEVAIVTGDAEIGKAFSALPFDHLVFTGSTQIGRMVALAAAKNLTPVTLELGGKSPTIIDSSVDMKVAADRLVWGKLLNCGQTCVAPDYALVPRASVTPLIEALRKAVAKQYPTIAANPDYTSIVSTRHFERLQALVEEAKARGAKAIELNPANETIAAAGRKLAPTLLLDVTDDMRVMQEEIFGPLLPIVPYDSLDEAIAYVNARARPLALYWFGTDSGNRDKVLNGTISGGVAINDTMMHVVQDGLPFGGVGPSGQGAYHGEHGFRQFSKEKPVFIQSRLSSGPLLYPPYNAFTKLLLRVLARWG